jgi:hypothetical protein
MSETQLSLEEELQEASETKKYPEKALSAARVRALKEHGRYTDGNCLYLIVDESGAKRWVLRITIHRKRHDLGLGSANLVSLAEAREEAIRLRKLARAGEDPLAERRRELQAQMTPTFQEAARQVHTAHAKTFRNETHAGQWISTLENYVFPQVGARRIDQIESADVLHVLSAIWMRIPETARRVRQRMKVVFDWAKASG